MKSCDEGSWCIARKQAASEASDSAPSFRCKVSRNELKVDSWLCKARL